MNGKSKRLTIGAVYKGKEGKPDYIKLNQDVVLKKDQYLNLESKKQQLDNLEEGIEAGRVGKELATKIRTRLEKMPDYVRFEIVQIRKAND